MDAPQHLAQALAKLDQPCGRIWRCPRQANRKWSFSGQASSHTLFTLASMTGSSWWADLQAQAILPTNAIPVTMFSQPAWTTWRFWMLIYCPTEFTTSELKLFLEHGFP